MSTRADIIVRRTDDKWARVYLHFDGYPDGAGRTLFESYNDQDRAELLVSGGDMSSLAESCDCPEGHTFDTRVDGYTVYYGRDRGETDCEASVFDSVSEAWPPKDTWTEFTYVWDGYRWWVGDPDEGFQTVKLLEDVLSGTATIHPDIKAFGVAIGKW